MLADYHSCFYRGGLPAVALPGADLAARQPWRNLLAQWLRFVPDWRAQPQAAHFPQHEHVLPVLIKAIERGAQSPHSSSAGRLFDAVAAATEFGVREQSWEGEAACQLEALAWQSDVQFHPVSMPLVGNRLDLETFWHEWLAYQAAPARRAHAFHVALAQGLAELARQVAREENTHTIVLSGGVLHNLLLSTLLHRELSDFTVLQPRRLPAGDGGLSLGQALIAAARG